MSAFQQNLRRILADRHSPEAAALFQTLLEHVHRRVARAASQKCRGLLSESDVEEVIGDVLYQLMDDALARFRGETLPELMAYVRTIADRTTIRLAQRRLKERQVVERVHLDHDARWTGSMTRAPDRLIEFIPDSPLGEKDQDYLKALLRSGSKSAMAKDHGVSRAAVTQRIQRIRARIDALQPRLRASHEAWMEQEAHDVLYETPAL